MDSLEKFKIFLKNMINVNDEEWKEISKKIETKHFKKNTIITREGFIENYLFFIAEGYTRLFVQNEKKETTFVISRENEFTCSFGSFINRKPSAFYLQAISDVKTIAISWNNLNYLYLHVPSVNTISRKLIEYNFTLKENREVNLLTKPPKVLYEKLVTERPDIIQNVPQQYIASYLGITPQALSRIKKQL